MESSVNINNKRRDRMIAQIRQILPFFVPFASIDPEWEVCRFVWLTLFRWLHLSVSPQDRAPLLLFAAIGFLAGLLRFAISLWLFPPLWLLPAYSPLRPLDRLWPFDLLWPIDLLRAFNLLSAFDLLRTFDFLFSLRLASPRTVAFTAMPPRRGGVSNYRCPIGQSANHDMRMIFHDRNGPGDQFLNVTQIFPFLLVTEGKCDPAGS